MEDSATNQIYSAGVYQYMPAPAVARAMFSTSAANELVMHGYWTNACHEYISDTVGFVYRSSNCMQASMPSHEPPGQPREPALILFPGVNASQNSNPRPMKLAPFVHLALAS